MLPALLCLSGCFDASGPIPGCKGTVVYPDGHPLESGIIRLRSWDYLPSAAKNTATLETRTDQNGNFEFPRVERGRYRIETGGVSKYRVVQDWKPLPDGNLDSSLYLVMDWAAAVSGTVQGVDGKPVSARVQVYGLDLEVRANGVTGDFILDTLPLGTHRLHVFASGVGERDIPNVLAAWDDTTRLGIILLGE